jgi:hypothetical protein
VFSGVMLIVGTCAVYGCHELLLSAAPVQTGAEQLAYVRPSFTQPFSLMLERFPRCLTFYVDV